MSAPPGPDPQQQQQVGAPTQGTAPPQAAPPPTPPAQTPAQGLPPTGIDQQLATVNAQTTMQPQAAQMQVTGAPGGAPPTPGGGAPAPVPQGGAGGSTSIQQLAKNLAQQYGLPVGRGQLVDDQGNFLQTPDQMAQAGGAQAGYGGLGQAMSTTAAKMGFISSAIANQQNREQQQKGIAAIQTGLGQVQSRGRGSLAGMQSGMYQDLADLYSNQEYEAADFSYFIQQGMMNEAAARAHRSRKSARSTARFQAGVSLLSGAASMVAGG